MDPHLITFWTYSGAILGTFLGSKVIQKVDQKIDPKWILDIVDLPPLEIGPGRVLLLQVQVLV